VRNYIFETWRGVARRYGFREYDGPPLEPLELYTAKSGQEIIGQLYTFMDKGDRAVALRPEMTPTLARMVATHARNYKKPIKWFAIPQLFRYERQQKGRLREHFQFNADIFGETSPAADAELIALMIDSLRALKLTSADFVVRLSSRNAWQEFLSGRVREGLNSDQEYEFYQIIDKLEREDPSQSDAKLKSIGYSLDEVKTFIERAAPTVELKTILDDLGARGLEDFVRIDYGVIRGLAYYTGPVFEAFDKRGEFRAIAGGGRYDNLVKLVSGGKVDLPGLGFGMGDVVLTELLGKLGLLPRFDGRLDVFCLIEDESMRSATLKLVQDLRSAGAAVDFPLTPARPDKQFKRAMELNAALTMRLDTTAPGSAPTVRIKNLKTREEKSLALADAVKSFRPGPEGVAELK
jgi:histidyl-tRNA synthetase